MNYGEAVKLVVQGGKVRRPEWPAKSHVFFRFARNELTMTHDQGTSPWIPSVDDLHASDYKRVL